MNTYPTYYAATRAAGQLYQDFVVEQFYKLGIPLVQYISTAYQYDVGENHGGVEIKLDDRLAETGNLWIEGEEKSNPNNTSFVPSGIFREDNSWLYAIGNYETIFIFQKNFLQMMYQHPRWPVFVSGTKTSKGILLSPSDQDKYAGKILRPKASPSVLREAAKLSAEAKRLRRCHERPTKGAEEDSQF